MAPSDAHASKSHARWSRREFLGASVAAGVAGACSAPGDDSTAAAAPADDLEQRLERDNIYTRMLGLRPHLPAHGHATRLGGSRMPAEVIEAMEEANEYFVMMDELTAAAGTRIAELVQAEAALVTSGASGGLLLGTAACLTGSDVDKMRALPHPTWPKRQCVIQTAHRYAYDRAIRSAGAEFVEVEGEDQLRRAIGDSTALIFGLPSHDAAMGREPAHGVVPPERLITIGQETGVPVLIDGASRLPPASNLTAFNELGADLVVISGGKGLLGPQSTGILSGRADLIEAARLQAAPNDHIGRGMKVGREEIIGLLVALERYVGLDHEAIRKGWAQKASYIAEQLQGIGGLEATAVTAGPTGEEAPYVDLIWDEAVIPVSVTDARNHLRRREARRVAISTLFGGNRIQTRCMLDGEEVLVARYLRQFFTEEAAQL